MNTPGDTHEQEADRVSERVMQMPDNARPTTTAQNARVVQMKEAAPQSTGGMEAPPKVHNVVESLGQPLDAATRAFMEPRFGHDFSKVRVHADAQAAESAREVKARAYTVGNHVVFGPAEFAPGSQSGRRLLSHELAHVVQQGAHPSLQRQPVPNQSQPTPNQPTPGFSVNQTDYLQMVNQAIQEISGNLVKANTLAPVIEPVLKSLSSHAIWRDEKGKEQGGGAVPITLPGTPAVVLNLRLVLDDQAKPKDAGEFQTTTSKTDGTIAVMVRNTQDTAELKHVLFHEGLHMVVWAMQNFGASHFAGQDRRAVRALNMSMHSTEIAGIRNQLDTLAASVNHQRTQAKTPPITATELDKTAAWLVNEAEVRAETKVFELYSDTQTMLAKPGPLVFVDTSKIIGIDSQMIDLYLFDLSKTFQPSDRAGLSKTDHDVLDLIRDMMIGIVDLQVKRQFNVTPYMIGRGIPREQMTLPPSPLTPPPFRPLPVP
jgi:Domain of unknown function (DUF4157)